MSLWLPKDEWKILSVEHTEAGQIITVISFFFAIYCSINSRLWKQFITNQTMVVRRPIIQGLRSGGWSIYIVVRATKNQRAITTRVTSIIAVSIGIVISVTTVCRMLQQINGLYFRVLQVCIVLPNQSREWQLKWCQQNINWTVSDWSNICSQMSQYLPWNQMTSM